MRKLLQPFVWILAPLMAVSVFVAAQSGLQMVRPQGLEVRIGPRTTADYSTWAPNWFPPVDPNLSTEAAKDKDATPIVITPPNPNVLPAVIVLPTTNRNELPGRLATSTLALVQVRPSATPSPIIMPSATPGRTQPPQPTSTPPPTQTPRPTQTPPPTQILQPTPTLTFTPEPVNRTTIEFEPSSTPTDAPEIAPTSKPGSGSPRKNPTKPPKKTPPGKGNGNGKGK